MALAQLSEAYKRARSYMNDEEAANWPDYKLFVKSLIAFEELEAELLLAGIPIIHSVSVILTIPPVTVDDNNLDMSSVTGYPTDMIVPIWMKERLVNQMQQDFIDMVEVDFIPQINRDTYLHYWCWYQNTILLRGAINPTQVMLRYQRYLPSPNANTDSLIVPLAQLFIGPRTAALCLNSSQDSGRYQMLTAEAGANLDRILSENVKQLQNTPAKRRPYHRGYGRNRVLRDF